MTKLLKQLIMITIFSLMILNLSILFNTNSSKSASAQVVPLMPCGGDPNLQPTGHWECYYYGPPDQLTCWCYCFEGGNDCCPDYDPALEC
ncbi:MAG: hypothetical protein AB1410_04530 [Acidobacteriota bacterium]